MLQRWDHAYYRARAVDQTPELPMLPTEYFRRNFMVTFEDDDIGVQTREQIGVEKPALGQRLPAPRRNLAQQPQDPRRDHGRRPPEEEEAMVWGNVQKLYNINRAALPA